MRAFTAKRHDFSSQTRIGQAFTQLFFGKTQHKLVADNEPAFGQRFEIVAKAGDSIRTLNIFAWGLNNAIHFDSSWLIVAPPSGDATIGLQVQIAKSVIPVLLKLLYG